MRTNVGSKKMLPYRRIRHLREGAYDEPKEQTRTDRSYPPTLFESQQGGQETHLDEFVASTGYHRKYAIRVLKYGSKAQGLKKPGRKKEYQGEVVSALTRIWAICGRICSKRLQPYLPEIVTVLERQQELVLPAAVKAQLLKLSRAIIDRCLKPARFEEKRQGLSTTKPDTLLKKAIPIRTFADWDDARPGFVEVDLVAHCGDSTVGQFLNTLTTTDISTGWTDCEAVLHRSQQLVFQAIQNMRQRLPFPLLGLDSDNGGEFINDILYRYCLNEQVTFTRSRPYKKNDQAHVEQKNWSVVRHVIGYDRFESPAELALLNSIYADLRLNVNFFQPVLKLTGKEQVGKKTRKRYDETATPYQQVLKSEQVDVAAKARLCHQYLQLNPVRLRNEIDAKVAKLWKLVR